MSEHTHQNAVAEQFSGRAEAYVSSAVHAAGEDLDHLSRLIAGRTIRQALDLGCGGGHVAFRLAPAAGQVVAYDLSEEMLRSVAAEAARRGLANVSTQPGRAEALPYPDRSFCMVASRYSAHHWADVPAALREARRVLKPGGFAVFMDGAAPGTPLCDTWLQSLELLRDPTHGRNYGVDEWVRMLREAGFAVRSLVCHRVRLEFASWVKRMATPPLHVEAIRALQARMPAEVARHMALEADGSFTLDTLTVEAIPD